MSIEVEGVNAKKPVMVADVERVIETTELGEDAVSEPVMVLDEAALTADKDIHEVEGVNDKKPVMIADVKRVIETAELGEDAASKPVMVLDEAEQTVIEDIPALRNFKSGEVKAVENAEKHEDTPEDKAVDGGPQVVH